MSFCRVVFQQMALGLFLCSEMLSPSYSAETDPTLPSGEVLLRTLNSPGNKKTFENVLGNPEAPVVIVAYGSLSCGVCAEFHHHCVSRLLKKYGESGQICLLLKDYPTDGPSLRASLLAWCVPDKSEALRNAFYLSQREWVHAGDRENSVEGAIHAFQETLKKIATENGLTSQQCEDCLNNDALLTDIVAFRVEEKKLTKLTHVPLVFFVYRKKDPQGNLVTQVQCVPEANFEELDRLTRLALASSKR